MLRMISLKAFVVSNIAHWIFFVTGWVLAMLFYCAGETISSDGTASLATVFDQMKSSDGFLATTTLIFFLAPIPAGYIAAKIAPHEKLLNGALSISAWFVFCVCDTIWGSGGGDSTAHMPHWLDALTTYGVPIPAMLGAYIWHLRADRGAFATANVHQDYHARADLQRETPMQPTASNQNQARRFGRAGTGLGTFVFLLMQFLLTQHERNVLLLAMIVALGLVVVIAFALKALKGTSG
ncbi:hypothetical protein SAMN05444159_5363 [Bradyrhizobium lablabi]|uniref:Uncharacterized protein n=1 Tax=Bradyrhizobium lablabi TaxID=722472 RepID=A0A1M6YWP3_9BRAD|nr:hypothetical protein [Bradyrhizobium lablabi]SHL22525.1 hypothetical protein SAMN05444159_5363 [Bradyrhizobium lablabi]